MGYFQDLAGFFGFGTDVPTPPVPAAVNMPPAPAEAPVESEFSLTDSASGIVTSLLRTQRVHRYGNSSALFPAESVSISGHGMGGGRVRSMNDSDSIPHGDRISFEVTLARPFTDYDPASLRAALRNVIGSIPAFKGHIVAKPSYDTKPTYPEVAKELTTILNKHPHIFGQPSIQVLVDFFTAHMGERDNSAGEWDRGIQASHFEGKVHIRLNAKELPTDKDNERPVDLSSDNTIVEYINTHKQAILKSMKEKAVKDGVLKPEELENLDLHVSAQGWNIGVTFGGKPLTDIDPETQKKWSESEYPKKMTDTVLNKVDTEKLNKLFTESLLETSKDLPPIMARIMDGPMLAGILRQHLPGDPELEAFLAKHDMFKTEKDLKAEEKKVAQNHEIVLEDAMPSKSREGKDVLQIDFEMPVGVKLPQVLEGIHTSAQQMGVDVQRTAAAEAAKATTGIAA